MRDRVRCAENTTPGNGSGPGRVGISTHATAILVALALIAGPALAGDAVEDPDRIRQAALKFAATLPMELPGRRLLDAAALDPRLRLQPCPADLVTGAAQGGRGSSQVTVAVGCPVDPGWTLYVPVQLRYRLPVVVSNMGMARGAVIEADDVRLEEIEVSRADRDLVLDPSEAIGQQLRRPIAAGVPIRGATLTPVDVIKRGDRVIIDSVNPYFRVRMQGESLQDAASGERVRVRNLSSKRVVEGIAADDGTVRIMR